jgi:hypothetical protein
MQITENQENLLPLIRMQILHYGAAMTSLMWVLLSLQQCENH